MLLRVMHSLSPHTSCLFSLCSVGLTMMCARERQCCLCALLRLLCVWMLHVHRDLCHPLKQEIPMCRHCCLLMIWKQTIKRFQAAASSRQTSVNTLHIWEGSGKGSHQRPTLVPFEMPQLSSAAALNDHGRIQPDRASQMLCCPNREQYVNRVQWPAERNCWMIQVYECDTLFIQLVSLYDDNKIMVPTHLYADFMLDLPTAISSLPYSTKKGLSLKLQWFINSFS